MSFNRGFVLIDALIGVAIVSVTASLIFTLTILHYRSQTDIADIQKTNDIYFETTLQQIETCHICENTASPTPDSP